MTNGLCQRCYASGVEVTLVKLEEKDGMITSVAVCEKCRE